MEIEFKTREMHLITFGKGRGQHFVMVYPDNDEIWVDLKVLPQTCFLCACADGISMKQLQCTKNIKRTFAPIEWLINGWGASDEWVNALKVVKENMKAQCEEIRQENESNRG